MEGTIGSRVLARWLNNVFFGSIKNIVKAVVAASARMFWGRCGSRERSLLSCARHVGGGSSEVAQGWGMERMFGIFKDDIESQDPPSFPVASFPVACHRYWRSPWRCDDRFIQQPSLVIQDVPHEVLRVSHTTSQRARTGQDAEAAWSGRTRLPGVGNSARGWLVAKCPIEIGCDPDGASDICAHVNDGSAHGEQDAFTAAAASSRKA
jgi:hypothetical protein